MQIASSGVVDRSGPPAFVLLALTIFFVSQLWSLPVQWMVARRLVREIPPARLAVHTLIAILASALAGGVPVLLACGLMADVGSRLGVSAEWAERIFILVLHPDWLQLGFLLAWLALAWIATSGVEAVVLRRLWRKKGLSGSAWSVAWRMNGASYLGMAALAIVLARRP